MMKYEDLLDTVYEKLPKKAVNKGRSEIPRFSSMVQGNQTFIKNFSEVAGTLRRDPNHLLKYVVRELATAGNFDGKRGIMNRKFREEHLNAKLDASVAEFIMCKECKKPDTDLITFEGIKYKRCEVCGARSPVRQV